MPCASTSKPVAFEVRAQHRRRLVVAFMAHVDAMAFLIGHIETTVAVAHVKMPVRAEHHAVNRMVVVDLLEPGQDDLALVRHAVAVRVFEVEQVRRLAHVRAIAKHRNAHRRLKAGVLVECRRLVADAVAVRSLPTPGYGRPRRASSVG